MLICILLARMREAFCSVCTYLCICRMGGPAKRCTRCSRPRHIRQGISQHKNLFLAEDPVHPQYPPPTPLRIGYHLRQHAFLPRKRVVGKVHIVATSPLPPLTHYMYICTYARSTSERRTTACSACSGGDGRTKNPNWCANNRHRRRSGEIGRRETARSERRGERSGTCGGSCGGALGSHTLY